MRKYYKLFGFLFIVFAAVGAFIYFGSKKIDKPFPSPTSFQELKTTLTFNEESKIESFDIRPLVGKSALDATNNFAKVTMNGKGENTFVTGINGRVADSQKHEFWELVINGSSAQVGAGSYIVQKGDSILWRLTTY